MPFSAEEAKVIQWLVDSNVRIEEGIALLNKNMGQIGGLAGAMGKNPGMVEMMKNMMGGEGPAVPPAAAAPVSIVPPPPPVPGA